MPQKKACSATPRPPRPATPRWRPSEDIRKVHAHPRTGGSQEPLSWRDGLENVLEMLVAFVLIIAAGLLVMTYYSYYVTGNRKVLIVLAAFAMFTVKGVIMSLALFTDLIDLKLDPVLVLLDLFILIILYATLIKK